jgi:hypothetical protein
LEVHDWRVSLPFTLRKSFFFFGLVVVTASLPWALE